ncbi:chorismate lyase [Bisgaard Taxon 46]
MFDYSRFIQQANWLSPEEMNIPPHIENWLNLSTSLTAQLRAAFSEINVKVLSEYWDGNVSQNEQAFFVKGVQKFWCREVLLNSDTQPLIFARTLIPNTLLATHSELQQLGNRALGEWLFTRPDRIRTKLEWAYEPDNKLYARRALVQIGDETMMVAELFLASDIFTRTIK